MSQQSVLATRAGNLPQPSASFVGRQGDLEAITKRLADPGCRLLTLAGPGGIGKTRLALEAAARLAEQVRDGAWLVELDALSDPALVPQTVASALGLKDPADRALVESLGVYLQSKQALLLLDNCEHVLDACAGLAGALLASCSELLIIATSREPLHVAGEVAWSVEPLRLPRLDPPPAMEQLLEYEAVELFVERAQRVFPAFSLTRQNAMDVAQICTRLDGLPLAIELAAVWVKVLSLAQMAQRLDDSYQLLTHGLRSSPARHQTLQATLDWSYDLLSDQERILFQRLAVFAGSFGLEAAEAICAGTELEEASVLELLSHLVDKSLVMVVYEEGQPRRYRLLETVRQYARQRHRSSGDLVALGDRHLEWYLQMAEELEPYLWGTAEADTLRRLDLERDNFRAALQWSISSVRVEEGLRLAGALGWFWYVRGRLVEGRTWLERVLALGQGGSSSARTRTLSVAGSLALLQEDPEQAKSFLEEALVLVNEQGLSQLKGWLLLSLGMADLLDGNYPRAKERLAESESLFMQAEDRAGTATVLLYQGTLASQQGNYGQAEVLIEKSLPVLRELGDAVAVARGLRELGVVAQHDGEPERAQTLFTEALRLASERGARLEIAEAVEGLAGTAYAQGRPQRAARLWGAAEALREAIGLTPTVGSAADHAPQVELARTQLGESAFGTAWHMGREFPLEQLRQYVEADTGATETATDAHPGAADRESLTPLQAAKQQFEGLTRRERQVAVLIALGMSNKEIAEELVVTVRTVEAHITSILSKLGYSSRTQVAAWAVDKGLAPPPPTLTERMSQD